MKIRLRSPVVIELTSNDKNLLALFPIAIKIAIGTVATGVFFIISLSILFGAVGYWKFLMLFPLIFIAVTFIALDSPLKNVQRFRNHLGRWRKTRFGQEEFPGLL